MRIVILDKLAHEVTPVEFAVAELKRSGKRRLPRPPRMQPPVPLERQYTRELRKMVGDLASITKSKLIPMLPYIAAEVTRQRPKVARDADDDDSWVKRFDKLKLEIELEYGRKYTDEEIRRLAELTGRSVSYWNRRQLNKVTSRLLDLDVPAYEPWLKPELDAFASRNVGLIKTVSSKYLDQVQGIVLDGFRNGSLWQTIAQEIEGRTNVAGWNAERIARDQVGKLNGQVNGLRQQNLGISKYTWRTSMDERVRGNPEGKYPDAIPSHWDREGKEFSWGDPPEGGHPGEAILCFPGSMRLTFLPNVKKAFRRRYHGQLAFLVTDKGIRLDATPNHPVLTNAGWKALKSVNIGDYVFETMPDSFGAFKLDPEVGYPSFEEVFNFLSILSPATHVLGAADQFHGDGTAEQIDIVTATGPLLNNSEAALSEKICEEIFASANTHLPELSGFRNALQILALSGFPTNGVVRGFCKLKALLDSHRTHPNEISLRAISWFNSVFSQTETNRVARNSVLLRQGVFTGAHKIGLDDLEIGKCFAVMTRAANTSNIDTPSAEMLAQFVRVNGKASANFSQMNPFLKKPVRVVDKGLGEGTFTGHVYNLETSKNWYPAQGLIAHNCRCVSVPVIQY